jgi:YD repeat-containing protein
MNTNLKLNQHYFGAGLRANIMHFLVIILPVFFLCCCFSASPAYGIDKNGISPSVISLPDGPGSIEGLGKSFQPNLNTGTSKYGFSFVLPPTITGAEPFVGISYDAGFGNGPLGIGWRKSMSHVRRRADKGIPRYVVEDNGIDDDYDNIIDEFDERDVFVGFEDEELIQVGPFEYRPRIEGSFNRYVRTGNGWTVYQKDGTRILVGTNATSQIRDESGAKVAEWCIDKLIDINNNEIVFNYASYSNSTNQKYLQEIRYGKGAFPWEVFYFVRFEYEDRPDIRSDLRYGFPVVTSKRLKNVVVGIQGVSPEYCLEGDWNNDGTADHLIRRYGMGYIEDDLKNSFLQQITHFGSDNVTYLPPLTFTYNLFQTESLLSLSSEDIQSFEIDAQFFPDSGNVDFIDMNYDGLPDLLRTNGFVHTSLVNEGMVNGTLSFSQIESVDSEDGLVEEEVLSDAKVSLADINGDGVSDLLKNNTIGDASYYINSGNLGWKERKTLSVKDTPAPSPFVDPDTRLMDLNFDKRIDAVRSDSSGYNVWYNLPDSTYSDAVRVTGAVDSGSPIQFSDTGVQTADMNGDRVVDVAQIHNNRVVYCPSKGYGRFGQSIEMLLPDENLSQAEVAKAKLSDINKDGLSDLVLVDLVEKEIRIWFNLGNGRLTNKYVIDNLPALFTANKEYRWMDIDGDSADELVLIDSLTDFSLIVFDIPHILGDPQFNNLLVEIDNGLGVRSRIEYAVSTDYYIDDARSGMSWNSTIPLPVVVVSKVSTLTGVDLDEIEGEDVYIKEFSYRNGYYDSFEKSFRGFEETSVRTIGDDSSPTKKERYLFFTGGPDGLDNDNDGQLDELKFGKYREEEPLKGKVRSVSFSTDDGEYVFYMDESDWLIRDVGDTLNNETLRFSFIQETRKRHLEGQSLGIITRSIMDYDVYGNVLEEKNYGKIDEAGDERFTFTDYIYDTKRWVLDRPKKVRITGQDSAVLEELRFYYDGASFLGLPYGEISKGNLIRLEMLKEPDTFIQKTRNKLDAFGNTIETLDGKGNKVSVEYESYLATYPITETVHLEEESKGDLTFSSEYNLGFGVIQSTADYNNNVTSYTYDFFSRPISVIRPGDSLQLPTVIFSYEQVDPVAGLKYFYDAHGALSLAQTTDVFSRVGMAFRKEFGEPDTFDTYSFTDGLGRSVADIVEDDQGYVVQNAKLFNKKGDERFVSLPYITSSESYDFPDINQPRTETRYDSIGRAVLTLTPPDRSGKVNSAAILFEPLREVVVDEEGNSKAYDIDGLGRKRTVREFNAGEVYTTRYDYDARDLLVNITDSQGNITEYSYDGLQRKINIKDPDRGIISMEYDDADNLIKTTDNKGQVILLGFDKANRLISEDYRAPGYNNSTDVRYFYDLASSDYPEAANLRGFPSYIEDLSGAEFLSYDSRSNLRWEVKRIKIDGVNLDYKTSMKHDARS